MPFKIFAYSLGEQRFLPEDKATLQKEVYTKKYIQNLYTAYCCFSKSEEFYLYLFFGEEGIDMRPTENQYF